MTYVVLLIKSRELPIMNDLIKSNEFRIINKNNQPLVSSRSIAKKFNKRHDNILRAIENLECSDEFTALNFALSKYKDKSGKYNNEYL